MKYFGKKSWSSVMSIILHVAWYVVLVMTIVAPLIATGIIVFSSPVMETVSTAIDKGKIPISGKDKAQFQTAKKKFFLERTNFANKLSAEDREDWESFKGLPLPLKILIIPYFEAVLILLLIIIKRSQLLFTNLKKDIVFNKSNVDIMSKIGKLLIVFAILTFNISALFVCVLFFMLREILKNATALQEEHDLTV
jgi:hypothetical protein